MESPLQIETENASDASDNESKNISKKFKISTPMKAYEIKFFI